MKIFDNAKKYVVDHKSEIFLGLGIGAILTGVVSACKGAYKLPDILEEHLCIRDDIEEAAKKDEKLDIRTETWKLYAYTTVNVIKAFVVPAAEIALGIGMIGYSFKIKNDEIEDLKQKVAGFAALAASNEADFNKYRERVRKKLGVEEEAKIFNGEEEVEVEETDEKGKKTKKKLTVENGACTQFVKYLSPINPNFNDDEEMFDYFVRMKTIQLNDQLLARRLDGKKGFLAFNKALDAFGFDETKDGLVSGWTDDDVIQIDCKLTHLPGDNGRPIPAYKLTFNARNDIYDELV